MAAKLVTGMSKLFLFFLQMTNLILFTLRGHMQRNFTCLQKKMKPCVNTLTEPQFFVVSENFVFMDIMSFAIGLLDVYKRQTTH